MRSSGVFCMGVQVNVQIGLGSFSRLSVRSTCLIPTLKWGPFEYFWSGFLNLVGRIDLGWSNCRPLKSPMIWEMSYYSKLEQADLFLWAAQNNFAQLFGIICPSHNVCANCSRIRLITIAKCDDFRSKTWVNPRTWQRKPAIRFIQKHTLFKT